MRRDPTPLATPMNREPLLQGADLSPEGVTYRVWAPACRQIEAEIQGRDGHANRLLPLDPQSDGYFRGLDSAGRAGDLYRYRLDGTRSRPDPASRWQPQGVHGPSMVIDPGDRLRMARSRPRRCAGAIDLVIYEIHHRLYGGRHISLRHLRHATPSDPRRHGARASPAARRRFPGAHLGLRRSFALRTVPGLRPSGRPPRPDRRRPWRGPHRHSRRRFIARPVLHYHGEYLGAYLDESAQDTTMGAAATISPTRVPEFRPLRALIGWQRRRCWMREFHADGFRCMDATHAIIDYLAPPISCELDAAIHARELPSPASPGIPPRKRFPRYSSPEEQGGADFDGVWSGRFPSRRPCRAHAREQNRILGDF